MLIQVARVDSMTYLSKERDLAKQKKVAT